MRRLFFCFSLCSLALFARPSAAQSAPPAEGETPRHQTSIEVIAVSPLHGIGIDRHRHPSNVQSRTLSPSAPAAGEPLSGALRRGLASVEISEVQSNPFQADLVFRGFSVSPLLGSSQGLAVYLDGVRVNETFGDTINWDLLPLNAIESVQLFPGSNPLFGLNALGGAISLQTHSGLSTPPTEVQFGVGSFEQGSVDFATSMRTSDGLRGIFVSAGAHREEGWRDHSPSRLGNVFARGTMVADQATRDVSLRFADNSLVGNGLAPVQLLAEDRDAVFTHPDLTGTRSASVTAGHSRTWDDWSFDSRSYLRVGTIRTLNGDDTPFEECDQLPGSLCAEGTDEIVHDQYGAPVRWQGSELDAVDNRTRTRQTTAGLSVQMSRSASFLGRPVDVVLGGSFDGGTVDFNSNLELARLTESRGTEGTGLFARDEFVQLDVRSLNSALFGFAAMEVTDRAGITLAVRGTYTTIDLDDRLGEKLTGSHEFARANPALGFTWLIAPRYSFFAGVSQSSRTPTPVELTCADPEDPCRLPNAFVADPPLEDVVTRTLETGIRRDLARGRFSVSLFQSRSEDDIIFVNSGALTSEGHFENVGVTRRRGLEASFDHEVGRATAWIRYSLTDASYGSTFFVSSPEHPLADGNRIAVSRGDRLPGVPRHSGSVGMRWPLLERLALEADVIFASGRYLRGDESNDLPQVRGFQRLDLSTSYALTPAWWLGLSVTNALDQRYETFGVLGDASEVLGDNYDDPRFLSPGAPRAVRFHVRWRDQ